MKRLRSLGHAEIMGVNRIPRRALELQMKDKNPKDDPLRDNFSEYWTSLCA